MMTTMTLLLMRAQSCLHIARLVPLCSVRDLRAAHEHCSHTHEHMYMLSRVDPRNRSAPKPSKTQCVRVYFSMTIVSRLPRSDPIGAEIRSRITTRNRCTAPSFRIRSFVYPVVCLCVLLCRYFSSSCSFEPGQRINHSIALLAGQQDDVRYENKHIVGTHSHRLSTRVEAADTKCMHALQSQAHSHVHTYTLSIASETGPTNGVPANHTITKNLYSRAARVVHDQRDIYTYILCRERNSAASIE